MSDNNTELEEQDDAAADADDAPVDDEPDATGAASEAAEEAEATEAADDGDASTRLLTPTLTARRTPHRSTTM